MSPSGGGRREGLGVRGRGERLSLKFDNLNELYEKLLPPPLMTFLFSSLKS